MTRSRLMWFAALTIALALPLAAQNVSVTAANPNAAEQGTLNLNVTISGKGFKNGAKSSFLVSGTTNPGGVVVRSTAFVNSSTLVANIDVTDTASVSQFDIAVENADGRSGHGTDLFSVIAKSNNAAACNVTPTPWVAALNTGATTYTNLGKVARGRLTNVLNRSVIMAVSGGSFNVEVFFLDPSTGTDLEGTLGWTQPHLSLPSPQPAYFSLIIADVNGDGRPDIIVGSRSFGVAWVYLGQGGGAGMISFSSAILLTPPQPNSGFGAALAVGDLDADGINEIALGLTSGGNGKNFIPGKVFLFRWNGSTFTNYQTIADPQNSSSSVFGSAVAIGDITGDVNADLVVGAIGSSRVWVFRGSSLSTSFYLTSPNSGLGKGVAIGKLAGSLNPSLGLLAVTDMSTVKGYIFGGPVSSTSIASSVLQPASLDWPESGLDLADINGDGVADVLIGSESTGCNGSAYLYKSSLSGYQAQIFTGPLANGYGSAASLVPGTDIVLVGAKWATVNGVANAGQVYVYKLN